MSSMAFTDGFLALVSLWLASRTQAPVALRLACACGAGKSKHQNRFHFTASMRLISSAY